ncbi:Uncharacterized protein Fot_19860 [Forsythia ovata]|uniref:Uncharacterized protein n=1 Tax=Forsythia ovata TaxID=205694 RepID=A0ABD1VM77_9LAMI
MAPAYRHMNKATTEMQDTYSNRDPREESTGNRERAKENAVIIHMLILHLKEKDTFKVLSCIKCPKMLMRQLVTSSDIFPWFACCSQPNIDLTSLEVKHKDMGIIK